jgi:hypothetical protein
VHELGYKWPSAAFYIQADKMAFQKMNFFSAMTTSNIPIDLDTNAAMLLEMQRFV